MPNNLEMLFSEMYILKIPRGGGFPVDINNTNVSYKAISYFRGFFFKPPYTLWRDGKVIFSKYSLYGIL